MSERRRFIKVLVLVGASFALAGNVVAEVVRTLGSGVARIPFVSGKYQPELFAWAISQQSAKLKGTWRRNWVMVIDLDRCDGCGYCTKACQLEHGTSPEQEWIKVYDLRAGPVAPSYPLPRPCMQCENAPCVRVCPVGATYYDEDGVVAIDKDRCIGCRLCMAACPYSARYFNWRVPESSSTESWEHKHILGTTEKCGWCRHNYDQGILPACVSGCPHGAIYYGDLDEDSVSNGRETWRISEMFGKRQPFRLFEELGTEPRVYYLPRYQTPQLEPPLSEEG